MRIVLGFVALCVGIPGVLLFWEYRKMYKAAQELLEIKEDYRSYAMTLKRLIKEKARENGIENLEEEEKKKWIMWNQFSKNSRVFCSDSCDEPYFEVVNRDPDHLKAGSLSLAKKHHLESDVARMFDYQSWQELPLSKIFIKKRKKKRPYTTISGTASRSPLLTEEVKRMRQEMLFSWPVDKDAFWFSSPFGIRRIGRGKWKFHSGIDLAACRGTPIKAAAGGIVIQSCFHKGYGNCISIVHNRKYRTRYAHLNSRRVKVGQKVERGEFIGTVGATGFVRSRSKDASHLHFEVYAFGRHVNPVSLLV